MSKETALQIAMRITHRYANSLFDEHTARGRQFMQEMSECLEQERKQIEQAFVDGVDSGSLFDANNYYNETYKGGEQ
ncbi:MAG: hypothetical protein ACK528_13135 [Alphaproteobacteria bacterium]|jgi:hypothetical protein